MYLCVGEDVYFIRIKKKENNEARRKMSTCIWLCIKIYIDSSAHSIFLKKKKHSFIFLAKLTLFRTFFFSLLFFFSHSTLSSTNHNLKAYRKNSTVCLFTCTYMYVYKYYLLFFFVSFSILPLLQFLTSSLNY